jgi:hypothetical protein
MAAVAAMTKQVHGDESHAEKHPEPVFSKPGHTLLLVK